MTLKQTRFELSLLIIHAFLFQVFNATDNLKVTKATDLFLGLNENFTELKSGDKSLFWRVFEKIFCHQFYFYWMVHDNFSLLLYIYKNLT